MRVTIESDGAALLFSAECHSDLDYIERMRGVHRPGPWSAGEFIKVGVAELGFDHGGHGASYAFGEGEPDGRGVYAVLGAVRLRADWLTYKEPLSAERQLRAKTATSLGHGLLNALELIRRQP